MTAPDSPGPAVWCDVEDDALLEVPPAPLAPLLPVLSLAEAHDVLEVLADVVNGGVPDVELARYVLQNLAARVPSRDDNGAQ